MKIVKRREISYPTAARNQRLAPSKDQSDKFTIAYDFN